jgi:hypothetical protein
MFVSCLPYIMLKTVAMNGKGKDKAISLQALRVTGG